jgi:hypothetical protein
MIHALALALLAPAASAHADLTVTLAAPKAQPVEISADVVITVNNTGSKTASAPVVRLELPAARTSPTVYPLAWIGALPSGCARSGLIITCTLANLGRGRSATLRLPMALPVTTADLRFVATVSTSSVERSTTNNRAVDTATLVYDELPLAGDELLSNRHCTGRNLSAFLECELTPSSISSHQVQLATDGSLSIPAAGGAYSGAWEQPTPDTLWYEVTEGGLPVMEFFGYGTPSGCFEGIVTFIPDNGYNSAYEVCP